MSNTVDTQAGDIGEQSDVKDAEFLVAWPPATYPRTGSFGYPESPNPTGPTGPTPPPVPPTVTNVVDDAGVVVSPAIPMNPSQDVWIRVNGTLFTASTELVFTGQGGAGYNHQWPIEYVSPTQLRTLITPANSNGVAGVIQVKARNLNVVSTTFGQFSFVPWP